MTSTASLADRQSRLSGRRPSAAPKEGPVLSTSVSLGAVPIRMITVAADSTATAAKCGTGRPDPVVLLVLDKCVDSGHCSRCSSCRSWLNSAPCRLAPSLPQPAGAPTGTTRKTLQAQQLTAEHARPLDRGPGGASVFPKWRVLVRSA